MKFSFFSHFCNNHDRWEIIKKKKIKDRNSKKMRALEEELLEIKVSESFVLFVFGVRRNLCKCAREFNKNSDLNYGSLGGFYFSMQMRTFLWFYRQPINVRRKIQVKSFFIIFFICCFCKDVAAARSRFGEKKVRWIYGKSADNVCRTQQKSEPFEIKGICRKVSSAIALPERFQNILRNIKMLLTLKTHSIETSSNAKETARNAGSCEWIIIEANKKK